MRSAFRGARTPRRPHRRGFARSGPGTALAPRLHIRPAMWRTIGWVVGVLATLGGCGGLDCDDIERVVSSPSSNPGTIRTGIRLGATSPSVAAHPDGGVVCVTCTGLLRLDAALSEDGRIAALEDPRHVALGPDGTVYTTVEVPLDGGTSHHVVALDAAGVVRWRTALGAGEVPMEMVADAGGVYIELAGGLIALDGATGAVAWEQPDGLLGVALDGVFTVQGRVVRHLDRSGAVVWQRELMSAGTLLTLRDAAVTPEGGAVIAGSAHATIDFGDRVLEGLSPGSAFQFAAEIDPAGATQWAFKLDVVQLDHVAVTRDREILLAGKFHYDTFRDQGLESFLALATPGQIVRQHIILGTGDQQIQDLQVSAEGGAWVQVSSEHASEPTLRIDRQPDSQRIEGAGTYLLELVP